MSQPLDIADASTPDASPASARQNSASSKSGASALSPDVNHRLHNWADRTSQDYCNTDVLQVAQDLWSTAPPDPKLRLERKFPTSRRDALKISFRAMAKCEALVGSDYAAGIERVLGSFPDLVRRTLSYVFLNYLSPYMQFVQAQGRHLFVLKVYSGREEAVGWFIPLAQVQQMHAAASESLRQGLSYNDLALTQTYAVNAVLAVHAETWETRGGGGLNGYGECNWIGGMAFHYVLGEQAREESRMFADVAAEDMPAMAAKIAKAREKKARQKANRKAKLKEEEERLRDEEKQAEVAEDASRRAGLVKVHESLAEALAKGRLL